ncbi:hypothetical protein ACJX0J_022364, partial [Zea mays]
QYLNIKRGSSILSHLYGGQMKPSSSQIKCGVYFLRSFTKSLTFIIPLIATQHLIGYFEDGVAIMVAFIIKFFHDLVVIKIKNILQYQTRASSCDGLLKQDLEVDHVIEDMRGTVET